MSVDKSWREFAMAAPVLADAGRSLLYQDNELASAYLASVAPDGGPRVHPIFPVLTDDDLWLFIVNISPKYRDLTRNGHFALHSLPTVQGGEEFHIRGNAIEVHERELKDKVIDATDKRQGTQEFEALFRCGLASVLHTRWDNWGTEAAWPNFTKWQA